MGLFDKLKNVLFEEEEIEEDVEETREVRKEIPNYSEKKNKRVVDIDEDDATMSLPKITKETKYNKIDFDDLDKEDYDFEKEVDHDLFKIDKTFDFPAFDEDEFEELTPRKKEEPKKVDPIPVIEERKVKIKKEVVEPPRRDYSAPRTISKIEIVEEKRTFKPSPVISPVYGILDKNYRKEDVVTRDEKLASKNIKLDVDSVRKKAFGTLEEDLAKDDEPKIKFYDEEIVEDNVAETMDNTDVSENLLDEVVDTEIDVTKEMEIPEEKEEIEKELDAEVVDTKDEELDEIDKLFEEPSFEMPKTKSRSKKKKEPLEEIKEMAEDVKEEVQEAEAEEELDKTVDESDLFELIDSMYENKEEE